MMKMMMMMITDIILQKIEGFALVRFLPLRVLSLLSENTHKSSLNSPNITEHDEDYERLHIIISLLNSFAKSNRSEKTATP